MEQISKRNLESKKKIRGEGRKKYEKQKLLAE